MLIFDVSGTRGDVPSSLIRQPDDISGPRRQRKNLMDGCIPDALHNRLSKVRKVWPELNTQQQDSAYTPSSHRIRGVVISSFQSAVNLYDQPLAHLPDACNRSSSQRMRSVIDSNTRLYIARENNNKRLYIAHEKHAIPRIPGEDRL